jgi:FlaA1/EpsC-like NDP-sugar epimerase
MLPPAPVTSTRRPAMAASTGARERVTRGRPSSSASGTGRGSTRVPPSAASTTAGLESRTSGRPSRLVLLDSCEYALYAIDQEIGRRHPDLPRAARVADVRDRARVRQAFAAERPELVFHAAALKHVPMVELNPTEGAFTNVLGTRNVADAALAFGALAMVQISTDKAVNPTNVMGATKRLAEFYCQALDLAGVAGAPAASRRPSTRFVTVRFGNVLGSSGSVIPLFERQLAQGGPLTVTHPDITRYFMLVGEAVELVLHALAHGVQRDPPRGEVYVLDMGEPIRIADLARHMIRLAGKEPGRDVAIEFTGLRPGEKLTEELFDTGEIRRPALGGVLAARSRTTDIALLRYALDELEEACALHDAARVKAIIARLVPGYAEPSRDARPEAA